jgi:hypothetical protein
MVRNPFRCLLGIAVAAQLAFVGLSLAQAPADAQPGAEGQPDANADWPREIDSPQGLLVVYEPQPDTFQGPTLTGRAAFSLTPPGKTDPLFGALWFSANVSTDRDQRLVQVVSGKVTRLDLPDSSPATQQSLSSLVEQQLPQVSFSLDTLTAALADGQEQQASASELKADPPKIIFATEPTVLVLLDGQPIRRPIEKSGIEAVVNTPFPLFFDPQTKLYYLTNGAIWYQTGDVLNGNWDVIPAPPRAVVDVVSKGDKKDQSAPAAADAAPPRVLVATEPTELVVTRGAPNLAPINGTQLLQVTNADDSIFRDLTSQNLFLVLAGRWYTARNFEGPWNFVASDQLPPDFAKIPASSSAGNVLAFVSGTPEAKQAVVDAEIPQTAEVKRDAIPPAINYDGQPDFQAVAGAAPDVSYAANSPSSVLRIGGAYYAVVNAVWYVAPGPQGPWSVATEVPPQVQTIPPASPVYNVRYVTIYSSTPDIVYTGYTPGYLGCYAWNGTVVYGTGYRYRPWVSAGVYYPRPVTWGFNVAYNPYTGWSYGVGPSAVFLAYGSSWGGPYYRPPWRPLYGGAWYGPGGYRPPPARFGGGWYSPGYRAAYYNRGSPYYGGRPGYGGAWARPTGGLYQRPGFAHSVVVRPYRPVAMGRPAGPAARSVNVMADRNGHVLRQSPGGGWQQHDNRAGWKPTAAPGRASGIPVRNAGYAGRPGGAPGAAPGTRPGAPPGVARPGAPSGATSGRPATQSGAAPSRPGAPGGAPGQRPGAPGSPTAVRPATPPGGSAAGAPGNRPGATAPGGSPASAGGNRPAATPPGATAPRPTAPGGNAAVRPAQPPGAATAGRPPGGAPGGRPAAGPPGAAGARPATPPGGGQRAGPPGAQRGQQGGGHPAAPHGNQQQKKKE